MVAPAVGTHSVRADWRTSAMLLSWQVMLARRDCHAGECSNRRSEMPAGCELCTLEWEGCEDRLMCVSLAEWIGPVRHPWDVNGAMADNHAGGVLLCHNTV